MGIEKPAENASGGTAAIKVTVTLNGPYIATPKVAPGSGLRGRRSKSPKNITSVAAGSRRTSPSATRPT